MPTTFDSIQRDKYLQEHWIRRLIAFVIDIIIIGITVWIITFFINFKSFAWFFAWSFFTGVILLLYAAVLESARGATLGKELLKLRVFYGKERVNISKALVRNISKIFWLILILDILLTLFTEGHPRQRYFDRIAGTMVEDAPQTPRPQYRRY